MIKASLAVQHGLIPPNMLFEQLNPNVARWYDGLKVPTGDVMAWPEVGEMEARRASVNSFGFGGSNAHAM